MIFRMLMLFMLPLVVLGITWYAHVDYDPSGQYLSYGVGNPLYIGIPALMTLLLPIGALLKINFPESPIAKMTAFVGLVLFLFWFVTAILVLAGLLQYTHANPREEVQLAIAIAVGAGVLSLIYILWKANPRK